METRVKKYKSYRKQINKEYNTLLKNSKNSRELRKLEKKLIKIDKSLIDIEEIDLFSVDIVYDDEWQNYLKTLKEILSFYNLTEIGEILSNPQKEEKEIDLKNENYKSLINLLLQDDQNYNEILDIRKRIKEKKENQENYKRDIKDLNNLIEKMLIECKRVRENEPYIKEVYKYNVNFKNKKFTKIIFIIFNVLFLCFFIVGIALLIFGGVTNVL